jgi:hypothetical protein
MQAIVERGGRVVVVDPRRTQTAERFEHIAVRPDGDAWLLLTCYPSENDSITFPLCIFAGRAAISAPIR